MKTVTGRWNDRLGRDLDGKPVKGVRAAEGSLAERPCSTATSRSMAAFRELSHHLSPSATFNFHHLSSLCPFQPGHVRWNGETEKLSVHTSKRVSLRPASHSRSDNPASWMMFSSDSFICSSTHKMTEFSVLLLHLLLSTPPSHFFCHLLCWEFGKNQSVRWRAAGVGRSDGGPSRVPALLGSALTYAGNMLGFGRFVLVRCTNGICAAQRRWWELRWRSVISAEGSSTSSPAQGEERRGERNLHVPCK